MIDAHVAEALNKHLNFELYSSYLYLSMSAWFQHTGLRGHAHWMRLQSGEEQSHVSRLYDYLLDRDAEVRLQGIAAPDYGWGTPLAAFEAAYAHEQEVTQRINELVDLALEKRDHATHNLLQWFVQEQVEEEANVSETVARLRLVDGDARALLLIDAELAQRKATTAAPNALPGA